MSTKPLTKDLILQKCKTDKLTQIKNVNLWGNDLDDLSILQDLPNVEIVSLSLNKIASLKDFSTCQKLTELYLRKNLISELSEVRYLQHLPNLRVLWLSHNPCAEHPQYRLFIIKLLPHLVKLDNAEVTTEERQQARLMNFDHIIQSENSSQHQSMLMQRKPSQVNVLQQNISIQNHQQPTSSSQQQQYQQSKSPFKGEINSKKMIVEQQQQHSQKQQIIQQSQAQQQQQQQQQPIIKKSHSVRPGSAMNERSNSVTSGLSSIQVNNQSVSGPQQDQRNENILCAVLALLKELGESELELVKRDIEKKIMLKQQQHY